jgi:hypothetical protein
MTIDLDRVFVTVENKHRGSRNLLSPPKSTHLQIYLEGDISYLTFEKGDV